MTNGVRALCFFAVVASFALLFERTRDAHAQVSPSLEERRTRAEEDSARTLARIENELSQIRQKCAK